MCDVPERKLQISQSFYEPPSPKHTESGDGCKSEINIATSHEYSLATLTHKLPNNYLHRSNIREYYKKYDFDELPVRDISGIGDKGSLTNSELDQLEMKIFKNISQELQTEDSSNASLESNIKLFKTTVQEIFDNFYASMQDFEIYKKRFHDILAKNNVDAVADMEDFIKDMIQHIMSSETSLCDEARKPTEKILPATTVENETNLSPGNHTVFTKAKENSQSVIESFSNNKYLTNSTPDNCSNKTKPSSNNEDIFNIFLLSGNPSLQIKINDRNLLSEINIKKTSNNVKERKHVASADDMQSLAAKKLELKKYIEDEQENNDNEQDIPVKVSYAKKDIHLDEDFTCERECEKSLISKICSFICRKFRRST